MIYLKRYDFTKAECRAVPRGVTFIQAFRQLLIDGVAMDLTGATVTAELRQRKAQGSELIKQFGIAIDNGINAYPSRVVMRMEKADTLDASGDGFWDMKIVQASGDVIYPMGGDWEFEGTVTP